MAKASETLPSFVELSPILIPYFLGFFIFRGFFSVFPLYLQVKFALTDTATVVLWGQIGSVAFFVGAASRLPAGLISDWLGRKKAIALGYLIYLISMVLIVISEMPIIYMIALSAIRFGVNMFAMTGRAIVSVAKRDRGMKNGLLSAMVGLGSFSGPYLFAFLLDHYPPDTIIFAAMGIIAIDVTFFLITLKVIPLLFSSLFPQETMDLDLSAPPMKKLVYWNALKKDGVLEAFFLFFMAGLVFGLISAVYSVYGYNILSLSLTLVGLITGASSLVQVIWAPIVGKLYDYVKDEDIRLLGWGIAIMGTVSTALSKTHLIFFVLGLFLLNLAISTYFTMEITRIGRVVEASEFSFVFGLMTSLSILGTAFANSIGPTFYSLSPEGPFIVAAGLTIPSFILVLFTRRVHLENRKKHQKEFALEMDT